jgi:hypothetical protein
MSIKRYFASKDSTITNAYKQNLRDRAVDANMGESDVLEVFSIYGQATTSSVELSRILVQFPVDKIVTDRQRSLIPPSGSVDFVLKMSNVVHPFSLPKKYTLVVNALSRSWDEGYGLDMETYKDTGPVNWLSASSTEAWTTEGGDIYSSPEFSQYFEDGTEDLSVNITDVVEQWIVDSIPNYGLMVSLSSSLESDTRSYYTKKFFSRGSEYFFKRPWIEARYDATIKDDRGKFYLYNPFVPLSQSYHELYIYNKFKGDLYDLPSIGTGSIYVRLFSEITDPLPTPLTLIDGSTVATGSWVSTGVYKASLGVNTPFEVVYDVWFDGDDNVIGQGGDVEIINPDAEENFSKDDFVVSIKNLRPLYRSTEKARFNIFTRNKNWNPNSYTSLNKIIKTQIVDDMYFKIVRIVDNLEVIPYGFNGKNHTRTSYDVNGNFFDLDMNLLEPGYTYCIKFAIRDVDEFHEASEVFKFKVEE